MMNTISLTTNELTFRQYLRFNWHTSYRRLRWVFLIAAVILASYLSIPLVPQVDHPDALTAYRRSASGLLVPVALLVLMPLQLLYGSWSRWKAAPEIREPKSYEFSDEGITVTWATGRGSSSWVNVASADTAGPLILIYTRQGSAYLIPTDAFPDEQTAEAVKTLLRQNVQDCRRLK